MGHSVGESWLRSVDRRRGDDVGEEAGVARAGRGGSLV